MAPFITWSNAMMKKALLTLAILAPLTAVAQSYEMTVNAGSATFGAAITPRATDTRTVALLVDENGEEKNIENASFSTGIQYKGNNDVNMVVFGAGEKDSFLLNAINKDCVAAKTIALAEQSFTLCDMSISIQ